MFIFINELPTNKTIVIYCSQKSWHQGNLETWTDSIINNENLTEETSSHYFSFQV